MVCRMRWPDSSEAPVSPTCCCAAVQPYRCLPVFKCKAGHRQPSDQVFDFAARTHRLIEPRDESPNSSTIRDRTNEEKQVYRPETGRQDMARFEEVDRNRGVDSEPPGREWMIVPKSGENLVRLTDGGGFRVSGGSRLGVKEVVAKDWPLLLGKFGAFIASIAWKDSRLFSVTGIHPGLATLSAKKGTLKTTLNVSVHNKLTLTVAFFFLQDQDSKGNVQPRTAFTLAVADEWINGLNNVFGPQANIWFKMVKAAWLPVPNLSAEVSDRDAESLAKNKQSNAKINIFLAGQRIINSTDKTHPHGFYHHNHKLIIVQDQFVTDPWSQPASPMLSTIAHEIGHLMNYARGVGTGHDFYQESGYNSDILNAIDGNDIKIPHQRVLDWNPW